MTMKPEWISAVAESAGAVATTAAVIVALIQSAKAWPISLRLRASLGQGHIPLDGVGMEGSRFTFPALRIHVVNDALRTATVLRIRAASYPEITGVPTRVGYFLSTRRRTLAGPAVLWPPDVEASQAIEPGKDHTFAIRTEQLQRTGALRPRDPGRRGPTVLVVLVDEATGPTFRATLRLGARQDVDGGEQLDEPEGRRASETGDGALPKSSV